MQLLLEDRRFYVYIYLDPRKPGIFKYDNFIFNYEPFYVGEGSGGRIFVHLQIARNTSKNTHKLNKIRNIWKKNLEPIILKLGKNLTIEESDIFEKYLIKLIGRADKGLGPLTNLTDGGKGIINLSQESKTRMSINKINKYASGEIIHWNKGSKGIMKAWNKGLTKDTDKRVKKASITNKQTRSDPIWQETIGKEMTQKMIDKKRSKEWKETKGKEMGDKKRKTAKNPERKKYHIEQCTKAFGRKVINLDTQQQFDSIKKAAIFYNSSSSSICRTCKNERKVCVRGYRWSYLYSNQKKI